MSSHYRDEPRWIANSKREGALAHYRRLELGAAFLERVINAASEQIVAQNAAIAAGVDPVLARFGPRAAKNAKDALDAPESGEAEPQVSEPKKPRPYVYVPRVAAPPLVVLGVRAAEMIKRLAPLIEAHWRRLIDEHKIDPRRLMVDDTQARMAALMLDELGIQYHEIGATAEARLRDAMNKIEAWMRESGAASSDADEQKEGGPEQSGPPVPSETEGPVPSNAEGPVPSKIEAPTPNTVEGPASTEPQSRAPQTYSAGGASLDWTRLC